MSDIEEFDPDRVREACVAVMKAHPIDESLREAYSADMESKMAPPLSSIKDAQSCGFLKSITPWDLAVYRVSYDDNAAWERILSLISEDLKESLLEWETRSIYLCDTGW